MLHSQFSVNLAALLVPAAPSDLGSPSAALVKHFTPTGITTIGDH
jgi:hypothetical protein